MKLVFISDTHSIHKRISVPDGDILIHCGDFTSRGHVHEVSNFNKWLGTLPHKVKLICAGNHDIIFDSGEYLLAKTLLTNAEYVQHGLFETHGLSFFMSPYSPEFCNWAFMKRRGEDILEKWREIPAGIDVLVTHGPPWSILDSIMLGSESLGCVDLYQEVTLRIKPKIHAFGHIHGGHGQTKINDTLFINASICNEEYMTINKPIVVEL